MLIAKINEPVPIDCQKAFPNTSFPSSGPDDQFLSDHGYAKVSAFVEHDRATQKLVSCQPYYKAPWVYVVTVAEKSADDLSAEMEIKAELLRSDRNSRLTETDWTQGKDIPDATSTAWASYRQALRDIPSQSGFPHNVVWPVKP
jgi:hypothetical protein